MLVSALIRILLVGTLVWVAVEDARRYRIRNAVVAWLAVVVVASYLAGRPGALLPLALFVGAGFAALAAAFALGWIGGGDAKLLTVALGYVGPDGAAAFAVLLLASVVVYALGAYLGAVPSRSARGRRQIPYGPSVAVAWMGLIALETWS